MPRHWLARPNRPLKPSSRSTVTPRCGHMNNTPDLTHLVVLVLRVFHISRVLRMREIISLGLTKVSPQMSPLSTQPTHWQHNQGAITLVFLSLVLWFEGQKGCHHPQPFSQKMVVKRLSIFVIKKKEPADYEPPHSAGIAYPSLKIIQYGIVLHRKYLRPVQPFR